MTEIEQRGGDQTSSVVSIGDWMLTILIAAIPIIGFIMLFVWGFGGGVNPNKANWAKATLIWLLVAIVFYALLFLLFGFMFFPHRSHA